MPKPSEVIDDIFQDTPRKPNFWLLLAIALFFGMLAFYLSVNFQLIQGDFFRTIHLEEGRRALSPSLIIGSYRFKMAVIGFAILNLACSLFYLKKSNNRFKGLCYFGGFLGALAIILCFIPASLFYSSFF